MSSQSEYKTTIHRTTPQRIVLFALILGCLVGIAIYLSLRFYSETTLPTQQKQPRSFSVPQILAFVHSERITAEQRLGQLQITLTGKVFQVIPAHGKAEVLLEPARGGWVAAYLSKEKALGLRRGSPLKVECFFLELQDHPTFAHTVKIWLDRCLRVAN